MGGFVVDFEWRDGRVTQACVTAKTVGGCMLEMNGEGRKLFFEQPGTTQVPL